MALSWDIYKLLDIPPKFGATELHTAYQAKLKYHNPDNFPGDEDNALLYYQV